MGRACSRIGRDNKYAKNWLENLNGLYTYFLEDSGVECKIVLILILRIQDGRCWFD